MRASSHPGLRIEIGSVLTSPQDLARSEHTRRRTDRRVDGYLGTFTSPNPSFPACTNAIFKLLYSATQEELGVLWPINRHTHTTYRYRRPDWESDRCAGLWPFYSPFHVLRYSCQWFVSGLLYIRVDLLLDRKLPCLTVTLGINHMTSVVDSDIRFTVSRHWHSR